MAAGTHGRSVPEALTTASSREAAARGFPRHHRRRAGGEGREWAGGGSGSRQIHGRTRLGVAGVGRDLGRRGGAAEGKWLGFLACGAVWVSFVGVVWSVARVVWWSGRSSA
jgi:hypothetical protein